MSNRNAVQPIVPSSTSFLARGGGGAAAVPRQQQQQQQPRLTRGGLPSQFVPAASARRNTTNEAQQQQQANRNRSSSAGRRSTGTTHPTTAPRASQQQRNQSPRPGAPIASSSSSSAFQRTNSAASSYSRSGVQQQHQQPHHLDSSERANTPSSTRSSTLSSFNHELEEVLNEVLASRVQSLNDVRKRIDDLADAQTREAESFMVQMQSVVKQSTLATRSTLEMEDEFEQQLRQERMEREKAVTIMAKFRQDGTQVMGELKKALKEVQQKYRDEVERSNRLAAELRKANGGANGGGNSNPYPSGTEGEPANLAHENQQLKGKVSQLVGLLDEEDRIVVELQKRCKALDQKLNTVTQQRDRLLDVDADTSTRSGGTGGPFLLPSAQTEEFAVELEGRIQEFLAADRSGAFSSTSQTSAQAQQQQMPYSNLVHLSQLLLQKIKSEQRQRLKVEEQAGRMAAAQDQLLRKTEARIKELERQSAQAAASSTAAMLYQQPNSARGGGAGSNRVGGPSSPTRGNAIPTLATSSGVQPSPYKATGVDTPRLPVLSGAQQQQQQQHIASSRSSQQQQPQYNRYSIPSSPSRSEYLRGATRSSPRASVEMAPSSVVDVQSVRSSTSRLPSSSSAASQRPAEPSQPSLVGLENLGTVDDQHHTVGGVVSPEARAPALRPPEMGESSSRASSVGEGSVATAGPTTTRLTLEEQLNAVTQDFHNSVKMWETAIDDGGDDVHQTNPPQKAHADDDNAFLPEEDEGETNKELPPSGAVVGNVAPL